MSKKENAYIGYGIATQAIHTGTDYDEGTGAVRRPLHMANSYPVLAKRYVPNVVMTVVDQVMSPEKIEICRNICEELRVMLRVRPFEN